MTKYVLAMAIIAVSVIVLSYSLPVYAPGPPKICEFIDDTNCTIAFRWHPDDTSSDPNHLVVINGVLSRIGLVSDSTNDVQAELSGSLVGTLKTISDHSVSNTVGSTTITTTVTAQSRNVNHLSGVAEIDGVSYDIEIKTPGYDSTQVSVEEEIVHAGGTQTAQQQKISIPVVITMCSESECLQGFGTIERESSAITAGGSSVTFKTDVLDAQVIGSDGLFELKLNLLERIVTTSP